jgi:DNA-binding FadR family transcriptional regulator
MSEGGRAKKLGELVADRITQDIIDRGWPVGDLIGREHELMALHGVSRSTVREAIRQLERTGVAQMRRGLGGGLIVAAPPGEAAVGVLATYLELVCDRQEDITDARLVLERLSARLLAERVEDGEALELRALAAQPPPSGLPILEFNAFRTLNQRLVEGSRNPALVLFTGALDAIFQRWALRAGDRPTPQDLAARSHEERARLVECIIGRDRAAIDHMVEQRARTYAQVVAEVAGGQADSAPADDPPGQKLSHAIAHKIVEDLKRRGMQPGELLGHEPEVQARYLVGRGVLREAIRLLEQHGLIEMRSGSSGGVIVGRPNPAQTLDLLLIYLRQMQMDMRDLWIVQADLEIRASALAARRASVDGAAEIRRRAEAAAAAPLDQALAAGFHFHMSILEACGNPVLELFGQAMIAYGELTLPPLNPQVTREANEIGVQLAGAIARGDEMFARRYMDATYAVSREWLRVAAL